MKTQFLQKAAVLLFAGSVVLAALDAPAQTSAATNAAPWLTYEARDVLKLVQAKVSDETVVAYVNSSHSVYPLNAAQIIYLRQQGISDPVLTAMLAKTAASQPTPASYPPQAGQQPQPQGATPAPQSTATYVQVAQPSVTYVQDVPSTYYNYDQPYYYYPSYGYSYGYWPYGVSFSYGWGGRYYGGGYRGGGAHYSGGYSGGFHGGATHYSGGFHGGGAGAAHGGGHR